MGAPHLLQNKHEGEQCIIVGNGVSLKDVSDLFLASRPTFGCNRIFMREGFIPTYYSLSGNTQVDGLEQLEIARSYVKKVTEKGGSAFVNRECVKSFHGLNRTYGILSVAPNGVAQRGKFSYNPLWSVGVLGTQTYVNLQLAYWMGFTTALLVGIDHDYGSDNRHFYPEDQFPATLFETEVRDFAEELIQRHEADLAYVRAQCAWEADGRRIINLTPDTKEEIFDRENLNEWI